MRKELLKGLTDEQIEKASHCKNEAELLALAKEEGIELTEEQLSSVSGGACVGTVRREGTCPMCRASVVGTYVENTPGDGRYHFVCLNCGNEWNEK